MVWVLKRTVSMRRFFWAPKTYVKIDGKEIIYNFTLKIFVYLNLCIIPSDSTGCLDWAAFHNALFTNLLDASTFRDGAFSLSWISFTLFM